MHAFTLHIISAEETLHTGEASYVSAPGVLGDLGIYAQHAPLLTLLKPGPIDVHTPDDTRHLLFVSGGILEVQPDQVTILADTAIRAENLDERSAHQARESAKARLKQARAAIDYDEALSELACASAQIEILRRLKHLKKH